jgi:hypothetical protein
MGGDNAIRTRGNVSIPNANVIHLSEHKFGSCITQKEHAPLPMIVFDKLLMQLRRLARPSGACIALCCGLLARPPKRARDSSASSVVEMLGSAESSAATPYVCVISYASSSYSVSYSFFGGEVSLDLFHSVAEREERVREGRVGIFKNVE